MMAAILARLAVLLMVVWSYPFGRLQPCSANRYLAARKGSDQWALPNIAGTPPRLFGAIKPSFRRPQHVGFIGSRGGPSGQLREFQGLFSVSFFFAHGRHFSGKAMLNAGHAKSFHLPVGQTKVPAPKILSTFCVISKAGRGNHG
jgi:hypothetical protein